ECCNESIEKFKNSNLVLINLSKFLERVQDDKAFAANKILVFDEAQKLMLNYEHFSLRQLNVTQLVTLLEKHLTAKLPVLEKRLLENLSFQLSHLVTRFYQNQETFVTTEPMAAIVQTVKELLAINPQLHLNRFEDFFLLF